MISPLPSSYRNSSSRRVRSSRSPSDNISLSKRSKPSNSPDFYDNQRHQPTDSYSYTSICVKQINPKISDSRVRELCDKKFSKYGPHSVKIFRKSNERVAFVNFTNGNDAQRARRNEGDLIWDDMEVFLEPVFYRKTIPANRPISPGLLHKRFIADQRSNRRPIRHSPSPQMNFQNHFYRQVPTQYQHSMSPLPFSHSHSRTSRSSHRNYSPYIPLPPDLMNYNEKKSNRSQRRRSSPSSDRHRHQKQTSRQQQQSRSPTNRRSPSHRVNLDHELALQQEPSRTLYVENLERNITESVLEQIFTRYGVIEDIRIKIPSSSSSKRASAIVKFENMEMAYRARQAMDGQSIGESVSKIGYGRTGPSRHLWVGNVAKNIRRRDLEHIFSRYGPIEKFRCSFATSSAVITYVDIEDAIKARTKLNGAMQVTHGQVISKQPDPLTLSSEGFHIDYDDRSTIVRRFISRLSQNVSNRRESRSSSSLKSASHKSSSASRTPSRSRSPSNHPDATEQNNNNNNDNNNPIENVKTETHSRSPTPPIANIIKQRRSTDRSETSLLTGLSPVAGRTFHGPLGSYLSSDDTTNINNVNALMILCEQLNSSATQNNTALSTVYPVQFVLKSHAYDARMHFLAGSSTLASLLLGQPGDLVAAKTELRITQRLRLEQHRSDDLEKKLRANVIATLNAVGNDSNNQLSNDPTAISSRKQQILPNQTKFSILIAAPKIYDPNKIVKSTQENTTNGSVKSERTSPFPSDTNNEHIKIKEETNDKTDDEDEPILSRLISYLAEKEAAGVISIPFYPTYHQDYNHSSRQETAVLHIFPPCQFSKKVLKIICPSITFIEDSHSKEKVLDEHLMVVIIHSE